MKRENAFCTSRRQQGIRIRRRTIVLASDGLNHTIPPEHIRLLARTYPGEATALTAECLRVRGTDNITVIVIQVS
jgi:serine/threonine protein phosphatase PrpC